MKIDGAVIMVTGAAAGLGQATAEHLLLGGAEVIATDRAFPEGETARCPQVLADITDPDAVDRAVQHVLDRHGRLDAAVHCAGVADGFRLIGRHGPADPARFRRVVEINLLGTFHVMRSAAWAMRSNDSVDGERGVIVTTASIAAFEGQEGQIAYAASKAGVVGMTLPAARDLGDLGIRCVAIAPGAFETALTTDLDADLQDRLTRYAAHPRRLGHPREFADLVEAVIRNPMLNAETIRLDGGSRLGRI